MCFSLDFFFLFRKTRETWKGPLYQQPLLLRSHFVELTSSSVSSSHCCSLIKLRIRFLHKEDIGELSNKENEFVFHLYLARNFIVFVFMQEGATVKSYQHTKFVIELKIGYFCKYLTIFKLASASDSGHYLQINLSNGSSQSQFIVGTKEIK